MKITSEQLSIILNEYLDNYALPRAFKYLPMFATPDGGVVLSRRIYKILRTKELRYIVTGDKIDILELFALARNFFNKHKKVYIVGLNYWATESDLDAVVHEFQKYFI